MHTCMRTTQSRRYSHAPAVHLTFASVGLLTELSTQEKEHLNNTIRRCTKDGHPRTIWANEDTPRGVPMNNSVNKTTLLVGVDRRQNDDHRSLAIVVV